MDARLAVHSAVDVRAVIARDYLDEAGSPDRIGDVHLRPHQVDAVRRLRLLLDASGGALLADEVGLGKTYTALAVAITAKQPLIVAPASLIAMWKRSADAARLISPSFVSHEALSRQRSRMKDYDLVIIDEAHHARNPATRRYSELSKLCAHARILLLSATPIHNSERDLRALFALFMGGRAWSCELAELTALIVRRGQAAVGMRSMPRALPPQWLELPHADELLAEIVSLPPPVPPSDGGDAGALVLHGLIRQWTSSDAAFVRALRRRRARAVALIAALEEGRYPTLQELRAWSYAGDSVQLAFPGLVAPGFSGSGDMLASVRAHDEAVAALVAHTTTVAASDSARATHLLELRLRHPDARIVAFTQFADTALGLYRLVAGRGAAAALTARGALTAGGSMSRNEALARFNSPTAPRAERIDLLLTTDLLSEGVDLPEVSVVVHLDLPWTPARLEQRVGRALRLNSRYREVHVYCMSPPASAEALLRVEDILRRKLGDAVRAVGIAGAILPSIVPGNVLPQRPSPPEAAERIRELLAAWRAGEQSQRLQCVCAAVTAPMNAWLALIADGSDMRLLVCVDGLVTNDAVEVARVIEHGMGPASELLPASLQKALKEIDEWMRHRRGALAAGVAMAPAYGSGTRLLHRIRTIASRAPLHRRPHIISLATEARDAVLARKGIASEQRLAELVDSDLDDERWLKAVGSFSRGPEPPSTQPRTYQVRALLALRSP